MSHLGMSQKCLVFFQRLGDPIRFQGSHSIAANATKVTAYHTTVSTLDFSRTRRRIITYTKRKIILSLLRSQ